jgi:hypothetical protein
MRDDTLEAEMYPCSFGPPRFAQFRATIGAPPRLIVSELVRIRIIWRQRLKFVKKAMGGPGRGMKPGLNDWVV